MPNTIQIRSLGLEDVSFLSEALYHAIFVPPEADPPPKTIVQHPDLARYIEGFGTRKGDRGILALDGTTPIGAAWVRLIRAYGFVDEKTPELSIALLPDYRGRGIGTQMMNALFAQLKGNAEQVSLSVDKANPAYRLYERLDFEVVKTEKGSVTMLRRL